MKTFLLTTLLTFGFFYSGVAQSNVHIQTQTAEEELKSVSQGRSIALSNTALSVGTGLAGVYLFGNNTIQTTGAFLTLYGLAVAPSTGNFYAEDYGRGLLGTAGRAVGLFLMADASREIFGHPFANALNVDDREVSLTDTSILLGEIAVLAGVVYNLLSISQSVQEYNAERGISVGLSSTATEDQFTPLVTARISF